MAEIAVVDLKGLRLLKSFNKTLRRVCRRKRHRRVGADAHHRRQRAEYLSLYLFGLLNPVVRSMRALCELGRTQRAKECL
ncbi:MAG TPA: hypothetical protein VG754_13550, partial [Verrucomicrobiae bacterium]|nr:hypothetical protein [Verrucomicrobiae bacterium]